VESAVGRTDLCDECAEVPGVDVEYDPGDVSGYFVGAAEYHAPHYPGGVPAAAQDEVDDCGEGENGCEDDICGQGGTVAVDGFFDCAKLRKI
jgi:hypothetical protein